MRTRKLGPFEVSAIGLGGMPMSMNEEGKYPDERDAIRTVHAALDAGVTLIDTADIYAPAWDQMGHNERLIGKALKSYGGSTDGIVVATKGGITRKDGERWGRDGSLDYLRRAVQKSMDALQVEVLDVYQWHRPDRWKLYSEVIGYFKQLQDEGLVKTVGISNANVEEIEVAVEVLGEGNLVSVQNEFSPRFQSSRDELDFCETNGIAFLPWSPLGGTGGGGGRSVGQRFPAFKEVGDELGVSPQQVVLAWELSLGDHVIPIPGARRAESITDSAKAADLELSTEQLERCNAMFQ